MSRLLTSHLVVGETWSEEGRVRPIDEVARFREIGVRSSSFHLRVSVASWWRGSRNPPAAGDARASVQQRVEALLPFVYGDLADAVLGEPVVNSLTHESSDRLATALAHRAQRAELLLIEIDIRTNNRLYVVHQQR